MIEDLLRETFHRHEDLAPAPEEIRGRILAGARRGRRRRYAVGGATTVLVVAALGLAGAVSRPDLPLPAPGPPLQGSAPSPRTPLTLLVVGVDSPAPNQPQRADTVLLVHLPAHGGRAYVISVPRATFSLTGTGGAPAAAAAAEVTRVTGLPVGGAVEVEFKAVQAVTDAVGGVDLCVDHRVTSEHVGVDRSGRYRHPRDGGKPVVYEVGCRTFTGWQALDYLRQRKSLPDGEIGRERHARDYLRALFATVDRANPVRLAALLAAAGQAVRVDLSPSGHTVTDLMRIGAALEPDDVVGIEAPTAVEHPRRAAAATLWAAVRDGTLDAWIAANPDLVD